MNEAPSPAISGDETVSGPVVEFRNVTVAFNGPPVLDQVSFTVGPRETRVLLGPAGVGKSVLLNTTIGLVCPESGHVLLFGDDISKMREHDRSPRRTSL